MNAEPRLRKLQPRRRRNRTTLSIRVADASGPENIDGERKTVTALFADIKGSMELMEDLDPEEARAIVDPALKLMIDAVHRYDGYIVQSTGDGIFALFGAPVAHEDHPQRALYAALRMQEEMRRYAERLRADRGNQFAGAGRGQHGRGGSTFDSDRRRARGVHADWPFHRPGGAAADAGANPGAVVVGESLRRLAEGYFQLRPLGPARIKGVNEPVEFSRSRDWGRCGRGCKLRWGGDSRSSWGARRKWRRCAARLNRPARAMVRSSPRLASRGWASHACSSSSRPSRRADAWCWRLTQSRMARLRPICRSSTCSRAISRSLRKTTSAPRREKVAGKIVMLDRTLEDTLPYLFGLLGIVEGDDPLAQLDPQLRRRRTLEAIKRILVRESLNQPLIVIFEDLHWIDSETQALLNLLVDGIATARILLLVNYRPEYHHQWGNKTYYTQLRLDPLGQRERGRDADALLASPAPAALAAGANRERSLAGR